MSLCALMHCHALISIPTKPLRGHPADFHSSMVAVIYIEGSTVHPLDGETIGKDPLSRIIFYIVLDWPASITSV